SPLRTPALTSKPTPPPQLSTLSLHDALPISAGAGHGGMSGHTQLHDADGDRRLRRQPDADLRGCDDGGQLSAKQRGDADLDGDRSEEHTSELQSRSDLVCRLLLEKKKKQKRR